MIDQLKEGLSKQLIGQDYTLLHLEQVDKTHPPLQPERENDVVATYIAIFKSNTYPNFFQWCKIWVFKDGKGQPLEWGAYGSM